MKNNRLVFSPGKESIRAIENYTDKICENLFINDTYFGNILMCLTELNEILAKDFFGQDFELYYQTDFRTLTIIVELLDIKEIKRHKTNKGLNNNKIQYDLLVSLSDGIKFENNKIVLDFNISALHKSIYEARLRHLREYFDKFAGVFQRT